MSTSITLIVLVLAAFVIWQENASTNTNRVQPSSNTSSRTAGFGDLRAVEAAQSSASSSSPPSIGFGDLRAYEAGQNQAAIPLTGRTGFPACPTLSTGFGEHDAGASAPAYVLLALGCIR